MRIKYEFGKVDGKEGLYGLWDCEKEEYVTYFETDERKVAVALCMEYFRNKKSSCEILDDGYPAIVRFEDGQPVEASTEFGLYDNEVKKDWKIDYQEDYYIPECTFCGDGGCWYCRPKDFL